MEIRLFHRPQVGRLLVLAGASIMLVASYLPWYEVDLVIETANLNGWQEPGLMWSVLAVVSSFLMAAMILSRGFERLSTRPANTSPVSPRLILACGGFLPLIFVALKFLNDSDFLGYGFYVACLAAALQACGGVLVYFDEARS